MGELGDDNLDIWLEADPAEDPTDDSSTRIRAVDRSTRLCIGR